MAFRVPLVLTAALAGACGGNAVDFLPAPENTQGATLSGDASEASASLDAVAAESSAPEAGDPPRDAASQEAAADAGVEVRDASHGDADAAPDPPPCGPATCPAGCCSDAGCVSGLMAPECGSGGQACSVCPAADGLRCAPIYGGAGNSIVGGWCCNGPHGAVCQ